MTANKAEFSVLAFYIRRDFAVGTTAVALAGRGAHALYMLRRATSLSVLWVGLAGRAGVEGMGAIHTETTEMRRFGRRASVFVARFSSLRYA